MNGFLLVGKEGLRGQPHNRQNPKGNAARGLTKTAFLAESSTTMRLDLSQTNIGPCRRNGNFQNGHPENISIKAEEGPEQGQAPPGFSLYLYPIIGKHWFGIVPATNGSKRPV